MDAGKKPDKQSPSKTGRPAVGSFLDTDVSDSSRRRLVRSAVAIAPMVLTLRSGALLAATSVCSGQITLKGTVGNGGKLEPPDFGDFSPTPGRDECFVFIEPAGSCPPSQTDEVGDPLGFLIQDGNSSNYRCSGNPAKDTNVVVITASSAASLMPGNW